jgi:UTP:GlnB (protein PII) uridylyltransferase
MLSEKKRSVLLDFHRRMVERRVPVIRMILFGSSARGEADEYSDLDVLVVVEKNDKDIQEAVEHCAWEAEFGPGVLIQPVVMTRDEMAHSPKRHSLLLQAVEQEGIRVA